jgi:small subunit ribosomal protein S6
MEMVLNSYESIFIIDASLPEDVQKGLVEKFTTLISDNGTLEKVDEWGKRRLAYPINDLNEGYYVLANFTCGPKFPAELDRVYKITDGLLRSIIVRKDK